MYGRILVPLDGSPFSEEVLPHAAGIARAGGASLELLCVASDEADMAASTDYLRALAQEYAAEPHSVIVREDVAGAIVGEANRDPLALVAMTSHGRTGLLETLLGSVSGRVFRTINRPVVLCRPKGEVLVGPLEVTPTRMMVLALDGSTYAETMIPVAGEVAKWLGAAVEVVQVVPARAAIPAGTPPGDVVESGYVRVHAEQIAKTYGVAVAWEVLHGDPASAIGDYLAGKTHAMLAMSSHARSGVKAAVLGSVAAECLRRSGVPILIQAQLD